MSLATFRKPRRDKGRKRGKRVRRAAVLGASVLGAGALAAGGTALIRKRRAGKPVTPQVLADNVADPWSGSYVSPQKGQYIPKGGGALATRAKSASSAITRAGGRVRQAGQMAKVEAKIRGRELVVGARAAATKGGMLARTAAGRGGAMARRAYDARLDLPPRVASAISKGAERDRRARAALGQGLRRLGGYLRRTYSGYSRYPALLGDYSLAEFRKSRKDKGRRRLAKGLGRAATTGAAVGLGGNFLYQSGRAARGLMRGPENRAAVVQAFKKNPLRSAGNMAGYTTVMGGLHTALNAKKLLAGGALAGAGTYGAVRAYRAVRNRQKKRGRGVRRMLRR